MRGARIRRTRRGDFELRLPGAERDVLRSLPSQLRVVLRSGDPALERLFPPAYAEDARLEEEYRGLVREDLVVTRETSLDVMASTIDATRLDEEQVLAWLSAINDLRLVLGTRLDVTEDLYETGLPENDPRTVPFAIYSYLGWLEEQVVLALASGLDPAGTRD
ncbi:MAG: DUF2017 domain-containing protein [Actinomycetota bacterium]|nr:DUF2017 domain-containing protein [Actinomycetota bacterium]